VISEVWHPGWRAWLDGRPWPLYRTNYALLGLVASAGEHHIRIEFHPLHWKVSLVVSGAAAAVFVLLGIWAVVRRFLPRERPQA
jgi:uncharacterized membrane protein YfhO